MLQIACCANFTAKQMIEFYHRNRRPFQTGAWLRLLRFQCQSNRIVISDGCVQKLRNDLFHDPDCNQSLQSNWFQMKAMFESHLETCIHRTRLNELRFSNPRFLKQSAPENNHILYYLPTIHIIDFITLSQGSVLYFMF